MSSVCVSLWNVSKEWKFIYELKLPSDQSSVHPVFHVSMLKKCIGDPDSILPIEGLGVKDNISYEETPIDILYC